MKRRSIYGLLPLVLLVVWLGCKSSDPTTVGGAASIAAAPAAIPSTPSPTITATVVPASATNPALPGAAQPPVNAAAQNSASNPQQRSVELKEIMNELKSLGTLDPQAQAQLIQDLQQTDPSMWPLVVQAFRTSLAYRQRVKATAATPTGAVATTSTPSDKLTAAASQTPVSTKASTLSAALATASTVAASTNPTATTPPTIPAPSNLASATSSPIDSASTNTASNSAAPRSASVTNSKPTGDVQQVSHETTAEEDAKAAELLARTIATLEREVQDAPQSSASAKAQLQLRMLYLAAGRHNDALKAMPGLSGGEQDFWSDEVFGLATYLDSDKTSDAGRRATEATLHLSKAASRLAELGSLTVRNLAFCTEVSSFGTYTTFPQNEFKPGQHVLLYAEVENFKSEESPKGFHTALRSSYHIFDHQGRKLTDQELPLTEEHCQNRRRDYFIRYFLTIPARTYDGKYNLQLTIEDTLGRKIGQSSIDFTVKEDSGGHDTPCDIMSMASYDVIVVGIGGVGSAALDQLATRGKRVLGLDRFPPGHDRGSSHGQTRIIRQAYYEHPDYVPLVLRAYELWRELEARRGRTFFHDVGLLQVGRPEGRLISGVLQSAQQHKLDLQTLSPAEVVRRFPGFRVAPDTLALFERMAGYLDVEACTIAHAEEAQARGAELRVGEEVRSWRPVGQAVEVETDRGRYQAGALVVTAGAWAGSLLADLRLPLQVLRKPLFWYRTASDQYRPDRGCPCYLFETTDGSFYGFPDLEPNGLKCAEHSGGQVVDDPLRLDRELNREDQLRVESFLAQHLPGVSQTCTHHAVCMYTVTPDTNFVVDRHPEHPQIVFVAGLSGHGFKFTPMLGEAMADLALEGNTKLPVDFLSRARLASSN